MPRERSALFRAPRPPRNITRSIQWDRVTLRRIKRAARLNNTTFSTLVYRLTIEGLPAVETVDSGRKTA